MGHYFEVLKNYLKLTLFILLVITVFVKGVFAESLNVSTHTSVNDSGKVDIKLTIENISSKPLYHIHPMFHFHHSMAPVEMIHLLNPGEKKTIITQKHPKVIRIGSYPLVVMVQYKNFENSEESITQVHTDSFSFKESLKASIDGEIRTKTNDETSLLQILVKNKSSSFKNIRLMLLLPPDLIAESFKGMMGFTIRGGEEKYFEVPVKKIGGEESNEYPVHLMVEYGEMLKHYSGDIRGTVKFSSFLGKGFEWPHLLVFAFLLATLIQYFRKRMVTLKFLR